MKPIAACIIASILLSAAAAVSVGQTTRPAVPISQGQQAQPAVQPTAQPAAGQQQTDLTQARLMTLPADQRLRAALGELKGELAQYYAARAEMVQGQNKKAAEQYEQFLEQNRNSKRVPEALYDLAVVLRRTGKYAEAIARLEELVKRFPADLLVDDALLKIGQIYEDDLKNYKEAVKAYRRVMRLHDIYGQQRGGSRLGRQLIHQQKIQAANTQYQDTVKEARRQNLATFNFFYNEAASHATFIDGNNDFDFRPLRMYYEARDHFRLGEYDACRRKLAEIEKQFPKAKILDDATMLTADAFRRRGELANANIAYEKLVQTWPESQHAATAWFRIGEFQRMTDRLVAARISYENALKLNPQTFAPEIHKLATQRLKEITEQSRTLPRRSY